MVAYSGYTSVSSKALVKIARGIAAETFAVQPDQVNAQLKDSNGKLGMEIVTALPETTVAQLIQSGESTLFTLSADLTKLVAQKMMEVSGHTIGEVKVYFNHIAPMEEQRRVE